MRLYTAGADVLLDATTKQALLKILSNINPRPNAIIVLEHEVHLVYLFSREVGSGEQPASGRWRMGGILARCHYSIEHAVRLALATEGYVLKEVHRTAKRQSMRRRGEYFKLGDKRTVAVERPSHNFDSLVPALTHPKILMTRERAHDPLRLASGCPSRKDVARHWEARALIAEVFSLLLKGIHMGHIGVLPLDRAVGDGPAIARNSRVLAKERVCGFHDGRRGLLLLQPGAVADLLAFVAVQRGQAFGVSTVVIGKRMEQLGLLATTGVRANGLAVERQIGTTRVRYWMISVARLIEFAEDYARGSHTHMNLKTWKPMLANLRSSQRHRRSNKKHI